MASTENDRHNFVRPSDRELLYRVGPCFFELTGRDSAKLDQIDVALPKIERSRAPRVLTIDLEEAEREFSTMRREAPVAKSLRAIRHKVYESLCEHIYVHGVLLANTRGQTLLIVGPSLAGKTTLSLALVELNGWKMIAEDVIFVNQYEHSLIGCPLPLSVRPFSRPLLEKIGVQLPEDLLPGWILKLDWFSTKYFSSLLNYVIILEKPESTEFRNHKINPASIITRILQNTNVLHIQHGTEILYAACQKASCRLFEGGTLEERYQAICTLVDGHQNA